MSIYVDDWISLVNRIPRNRRKISRLSHTTDREWAMDHSRRQFLVRESRNSDHQRIAPLDLKDELITIIRLSDGRAWCFSKRSRRFPSPYQNTQSYARARLGCGDRDLDRAIAVCGL